MHLEVKKGEFGYKDGENIFQNISFLVREGEILSILGPNGAGKTTLLKCIIGLLKWKNGKTIIDGEMLNSVNDKKIRKKIGYVPQARSEIFPYSVLKMVVMGRAPHLSAFSIPSSNDYEIANQAIETTGIVYLRDKLCTELSGGERQLVLIARALSSEPEVLFLDEPESHLDFRNQLIIMDILRKLATERQIACVINTHSPDHAMRISNKALILNKGEEHTLGRVEDVITEDNLRNIWGVKVKIVNFSDDNRNRKTIVPLEVIS